jgi:hypothetical protein
VGQEKEGTPTKPLNVTVVDAATGTRETMPQPAVGTPEDLAFWKPVLTELRQHLEKRGWFDAAMIRHVSYWAPRCFVWVDVGGQPARPPGIFRLGTSRQGVRIEAAGPREADRRACRRGP